jgi:uncharacterized protein YggT (Ycf19 family)
MSRSASFPHRYRLMWWALGVYNVVMLAWFLLSWFRGGRCVDSIGPRPCASALGLAFLVIYWVVGLLILLMIWAFIERLAKRKAREPTPNQGA